MGIDIGRMYAKIKSEHGLIAGVPVVECTLPIKTRKFVFRGDLDENGDDIHRTFQEALGTGDYSCNNYFEENKNRNKRNYGGECFV